LDVALLAARGSAAARRIAEGGDIDNEDQRSLTAVAQLLKASAKAIGAFGGQVPHRAPPSGALAARVEVAIDAVLQDADASVDAPRLSNLLEDLANRVQALAFGSDRSDANQVVHDLSGLASSALRETGHVGETTSTL
jgi:hypothetical protein